MEWTDEKVFKLLKLYESYPCMYDVACKEYHNRNAADPQPGPQ